MAAYVASGTGGGTSGSGNRSINYTPSGVGNLLIVFVIVSGNTNSAPTVSDAGGAEAGTYARINTALKNSSADTMSLHVREQTLGNVDPLVITAATGSNTAGQIIVIEVSGMSRKGAQAVLQSAKQENQAAGGTPAPAFSASALTGNMTLGAVANGSNPAGITAPSGWTERQDAGQNTPSTGLEAVTRDSGFTGTTITWGSTSASAFASIIAELDNSAAPSGSLPLPPRLNTLLRM